MIRAKFKCTEVTKQKSWRPDKGDFIFNAKLDPVVGGSPENDEFYAATPAGTISLQAFCADVFEPGKEYYVDFTPVG